MRNSEGSEVFFSWCIYMLDKQKSISLHFAEKFLHVRYWSLLEIAIVINTKEKFYKENLVFFKFLSIV